MRPHRANFTKASLATKGDFASINFYKADLIDANFGKAALNTEGYDADINFYEANLIGASFEEASLATEGDKSPIFAGADLTDANFEEASRNSGRLRRHRLQLRGSDPRQVRGGLARDEGR